VRYFILSSQALHATSQHLGAPVTNIHSSTQRMGDALVALRPSQLRTKPCPVKTTSNGWTSMRGFAIFAKACFGHPSLSQRQKLNATVNAFGAPIRPRHLVPTQQGVGT